MLQCHFSLSQPLVKRQRHEPIVYFLHSDVCEGFYVLLCGELCFCMFANADGVMSIVYFCIYACVCVCESWLCPLEFPENPDRTHLIATHHIVTPSARYGTHSAHPVLPFPFTLPSSLLLSTFFYCSIHTFFCSRLHFIGTTLLRGCFCKGPKLVITQS